MGRGRGKGKRGGRGGGLNRSCDVNCEWAKLEIVFGDDCYVEKLANLECIGGDKYVTSLEDIEVRNDREAAWRARRKSRGDDDDDNEDSADDGGGYDEDLAEQARAQLMLQGDQDAKQRKPKGVEAVIGVENPNRQRQASAIKVKNTNEQEAPELSRREREAIEAVQRKERYMKLQAAGQTQEAKDDLARLAEVRKRREAAAASGSSGLPGAPDKANESESDGNRIQEGDSNRKDNSEGKKDFEKLDALQIKKMNPTKLKDLLKQRGESLQGSKKDLMTRLLAWEENNHS